MGTSFHHLRGISSKATQQLLAVLVRTFERDTGVRVQVESVGGVDALRRVQAGEAFDLVFLAADATSQLLQSGHLHAGSRVDLFKSPVAVAVAAGAPIPDIASAAALRRALQAAPSIGLSTGPSGTCLKKLMAGWGLWEELQGRIVQPPPGVPVGSLLASGQVALGLQQLSELMGLQGISVVGTLPAEAGCITTFCAGLGATLDLGSERAEAARQLLHHMRLDATAQAQQHGMQPA